MTLIERLGTDKPDKPGLWLYAPPKRRAAPEEPSDVDRAAASVIPHQQKSAANPANGPAAEKLNELIRRVSGASMEEIDRVISELQSVSDMLRNEGERVSREIAGYASLSHALMTAMKVISDSLTLWRSGPDKSGPRPAA